MIHAFASARVVLEEQVNRNAAIARRLPEARFASYWGAHDQEIGR